MSTHRFVVAALLAAVLPGAASAQTPVDTSAGAARQYRTPNGAALTSPSASTPGAIVAAFVRARHAPATADSLTLRKENLVARTGVTHVEFGQRVGGLDVHGTYVRASVSARGELVSLIENLAPLPPALVPAAIDARDALAAVLGRYYPGVPPDFAEIASEGTSTTFGRGGLFSSDPTVTRVAVPMANGAMHAGFLVETWDRDNVLRHTVVGPGGRILREELRTNNDSYKVFPNHPGISTQTVVTGPGAGNPESPIGWVINDTTTGNNVDAYLDRDMNNAADPGGRPVSSSKEFVYTADLTQEPTNATNQMAAVTNLFYLNNVIHDKLYRHGFTEEAGNFQVNNFGKGGVGNDPVLAEAQDGSGTNNANFSTPADGSKPRMQMFIWTRTTPNRDGDLDSDIVWHEYGHGLTWRMIGSMSSPLSGAVGEGMSDTLSIYVNRNDVVAEYSSNSEVGIRRYPYTNYQLTYGDVTGNSVHADGEIYAATMWKLLELWEASGRSQDELFDYIVDGMNFTPPGPAYEDMRDGILAAVPTDEADCIVWQAFAQFGIGEGADGLESCLITCRLSSITASFKVPAFCSGFGAKTPPAVSISAPANNTSVVLGTDVTFAGMADDAESGNLSGSLAWASSIQGQLGTGASFTTSALLRGTHTVTASVTDSGGLTGSAAIQFTITEPASSITLTALGYTLKTQRRVDLTWSGATTASVDVFRNGARITTTLNDGLYTDKTGLKTIRSFTYKVCNAGTTSCSSEVTIGF